MQVTVKLYASLRWKLFKEEAREYAAGATIADVAAALGIPGQDIGIMLINGSHAALDQVLHDGDVLSLMPRIGGG
jgi:molybdopterin converting factor small subunit